MDRKAALATAAGLVLGLPSAFRSCAGLHLPQSRSRLAGDHSRYVT